MIKAWVVHIPTSTFNGLHHVPLFHLTNFFLGGRFASKSRQGARHMFDISPVTEMLRQPHSSSMVQRSVYVKVLEVCCNGNDDRTLRGLGNCWGRASVDGSLHRSLNKLFSLHELKHPKAKHEKVSTPIPPTSIWIPKMRYDGSPSIFVVDISFLATLCSWVARCPLDPPINAHQFSLDISTYGLVPTHECMKNIKN